MDPYLIARWLHIVSSTVLFGTGIGTAFQMVCAMRTGRAETIRSVSSAVVLADAVFTTPAGIIQPLTGLWLIHLAGHSPTAPWLLVCYVLYVLAFACWLPVVGLQIRIRNLAAAAVEAGTPLPAEVLRLYRMWFALGWPAFGALIGIFWLMVSKPDLGF
ncbi:DUF2269 domain-containing protein [Fertoebacter nigrum]|uniref:DUF2269 domain-containing protein n=1 Tax=Fertoeibacter niger TaxID=2656921 RepID=A0A8X8H0T8_9RHOB|nr:DUF2269 domain-containing protein [Fertoeibacter niger]NUB44057.1 DUF2269 domain-containing protein [Fertoeibacter niger]